MTQIDLCTDTLILVNFIWYKRFSLPPPPSNFSISTFFRMTFHIYIYIYIYIVILIKFYKKKRERDIGGEKLKYQAELTKIRMHIYTDAICTQTLLF